MSQAVVRLMLDPTTSAREAGRQQGRTEMREQIATMFASFASSHPDPVVSDELWGFVHHIREVTV